jgi:hypothetical protein
MAIDALAPPPVPSNSTVNAQDWALVVGIQIYPGLIGPNGTNKNLGGPENDAGDFYNWLIAPAPEGGGIPEAQAKLIRSSNYPEADDGPLSAHPSYADLELALMRFDALAKRGPSVRVGRRLYLYFSGHGCAPAPNESALLTADFTTDYLGFHVPGRLWAHIFAVRGYFDEVFLLMDCCRENLPSIDIRKPPLDMSAADATAVDNCRKFYGFATKWSRTTKELPFPFPGGAVHGVFTYALLDGLSGKAADPGTGEITAATLGSWLSDNLSCYLPKALLADSDVPKKPDLDYDPQDARKMVLARVIPPKFPVRLTMSAAVIGTLVEILDGDLNLVMREPNARAVWDVKLFRGLYLAQSVATNRREKIIVNGVGGVDVQL